MPAVNYKTVIEQTCEDRAISQWEASLKRPDLTEYDRVRGAIEAYQRQAFVFASMPQGEVYRHKKRGTEYEVIGKGKLQATSLYKQGFDDVWLTPTYKGLDLVEVVVYRSIIDETEIWVRPVEEFFDGRFELVTNTEE